MCTFRLIPTLQATKSKCVFEQRNDDKAPLENVETRILRSRDSKMDLSGAALHAPSTTHLDDDQLQCRAESSNTTDRLTGCQTMKILSSEVMRDLQMKNVNIHLFGDLHSGALQ